MTMHGFLCGPDGEPLRYDVDEWTTGAYPTCEMVFRAKYATKIHIKDYHDTMTGEFFMYWIEKRLTPSFEARYPGKNMILVLDNAPYHHSLVENGFRPNSMSKDDIVARIHTLKRKLGVPRLTSITIKPYTDLPEPPGLPSKHDPSSWSKWVFLDNSGEVWTSDGINDEGFGDAVIHARVGGKKTGTVEQTVVPDFEERRSHNPASRSTLVHTRLWGPCDQGHSSSEND